MAGRLSPQRTQMPGVGFAFQNAKSAEVPKDLGSVSEGDRESDPVKIAHQSSGPLAVSSICLPNQCSLMFIEIYAYIEILKIPSLDTSTMPAFKQQKGTP